LFSQPTVAEAVTHWAYASLPVDLLGVAMQTKTGKPVKQLFNERVSPKIGPPEVNGKTIGPYTRAASGAAMSARNLARIGQMLLNRGRLGSRVVMTTGQHSGLISHASFLDSVESRLAVPVPAGYTFSKVLPTAHM
jgi:CubicO group peptidase (beta-lactamase class C family)